MKVVQFINFCISRICIESNCQCWEGKNDSNYINITKDVNCGINGESNVGNKIDENTNGLDIEKVVYSEYYLDLGFHFISNKISCTYKRNK